MATCFWMLKQPRFIKCFDAEPSANNIMFLFNSCVESICEPSFARNGCYNVINIIQAVGCANVGRLPILANFLSGSLCPPYVP
ncbi:hypothetical protein PoB_005455200 [Plakobranchus ocellatus]|uniref:Uncharacterized protein n=1 Tax=Plakobranchus ocellatus TaxID=259542 RepID=A0AAV4C938_9GAST|nr:hypothetical protein PoB_005455200 [Plakobranchus ocellatus]